MRTSSIGEIKSLTLMAAMCRGVSPRIFLRIFFETVDFVGEEEAQVLLETPMNVNECHIIIHSANILLAHDLPICTHTQPNWEGLILKYVHVYIDCSVQYRISSQE